MRIDRRVFIKFSTGAAAASLAGVPSRAQVDASVDYGRLCMKGYALPHIMYGEDRLSNLSPDTTCTF